MSIGIEIETLSNDDIAIGADRIEIKNANIVIDGIFAKRLMDVDRYTRKRWDGRNEYEWQLLDTIAVLLGSSLEGMENVLYHTDRIHRAKMNDNTDKRTQGAHDERNL